jgi:hypothetical protein
MTPEEASEWELERFGSCSGPVKKDGPHWLPLPEDEIFKENYSKWLLAWLQDLCSVRERERIF